MGTLRTRKLALSNTGSTGTLILYFATGEEGILLFKPLVNGAC